MDTFFAALTYWDDIVDHNHLPAEERMAHITAWSDSFTFSRPHESLSQRERALWRAMEFTMRTWLLPRTSVLNYLFGQRDALVTTEYATDQDLRAYLGTVTLETARWANVLCEPITPEAAKVADEVITVFQWVDFLCDIREDLDAGRLYIPISRLHGMSRNEFEERLRRDPRDRLILSIIREIAAENREKLQSGPDWSDLIHPSSREFVRMELAINAQMLERLLTDDRLLEGKQPRLGYTKGKAITRACTGILRARRPHRLPSELASLRTRTP